MRTSTYVFTAAELARLASYRAAVRAGFYEEGWGPHGPDRPVQVRLSFAQPMPVEAVKSWRERIHPEQLTEALRRLGVVREQVYVQDTPSGGLVFIASEVRSVGPAFEEQLLALHGLRPGQPGPAGSASLVLDWAEQPES